jgi:hypothetical protein
MSQSGDSRLPHRRHRRWHVLVVVVAISTLTVSLATRTSTPRISQGIAAQSQSPLATRQHLETAAEWVPPVAPVVLFEVVSFYPRVSPAGPPISGLRFDESL